MTPLMAASSSGHVDVVRVLMEAHANVNQHSQNGETAISLARANGHMEVLQLLRAQVQHAPKILNFIVVVFIPLSLFHTENPNAEHSMYMCTELKSTQKCHLHAWINVTL